MLHGRTILALAISMAPAGLWAAERTSTVDITAITIVGDSINSGAVDLIDPATGISLKPKFQGFHGSGIPYGEYILKVSVLGFKHHEQRLRIFQPRVYARIGLSLAQITDEEPQRLVGLVKPVPVRKGEVWIKLVPILTNGITMDAPVGADGSFEFAGMEQGRYLIVVVKGMDWVATKQVDTSMTNIEVFLPQR